jgi:hypothetical protein
MLISGFFFPFCRLPVLKEIPILSLLTRCLSSKKSSVRQRFLHSFGIFFFDFCFVPRVSRLFLREAACAHSMPSVDLHLMMISRYRDEGGGGDTIAT